MYWETIERYVLCVPGIVPKSHIVMARSNVVSELISISKNLKLLPNQFLVVTKGPSNVQLRDPFRYAFVVLTDELQQFYFTGIIPRIVFPGQGREQSVAEEHTVIPSDCYIWDIKEQKYIKIE